MHTNHAERTQQPAFLIGNIDYPAGRRSALSVGMANGPRARRPSTPCVATRAALAWGWRELVRNHAAQEGEVRGHLAAALGIGLQIEAGGNDQQVDEFSFSAADTHHLKESGKQSNERRFQWSVCLMDRKANIAVPSARQRTTARSAFATAAATLALQSAASTRSKVPNGRAMDAGAWTLRHGSTAHSVRQQP